MELLGCAENGLLTDAGLSRMVAHLGGDGLGLIPVESGYMLAADATSVAAVERVFAAKQRARSMPLPLAVAGLAQAAPYVIVPLWAEALGRCFLPGPLALVLEGRGGLAPGVSGPDGTSAIRVPDSPVALQIASALGRPLTATSANRSGTGAYQDLADIERQLEPQGMVLAVPASGFEVPCPSTLVRWEDGDLVVLREGPVSLADMRECLSREGREPVSEA